MPDLKIPEPAERLFSRVFQNLTQRHTEVITFRKLAALGQQPAIASLSAENYKFALSLLNDPQYDKFFKDRKGAVAFLGGPAAIGSLITSKQVSLFNAAVDAASLVFVHSAVDAALSDLCRVTYLIDPSRWRPFVESQKVALSDLHATSTEELWNSRLEAYLTALERESLRKRTERLFGVCTPPREFDPIGNFKYDLISVERLDKVRQDIIHGSGPNTIHNCDAELEYLVKVGLYFFAMVNKAFGVKVNPLFALGLELPIARGSKPDE